MAGAQPRHQRHADRPEHGVGGTQEADGPLEVTGRGGEERGRLEHELGEPAVAELDEERERLLELGRGGLGVAEPRVDLRDAPEHLAEAAAIADRAQDVEALGSLRPGLDLVARRMDDGQAVEREGDAVGVAEAPEPREARARRAARARSWSPVTTKCIASRSSSSAPPPPHRRGPRRPPAPRRGASRPPRTPRAPAAPTPAPWSLRRSPSHPPASGRARAQTGRAPGTVVVALIVREDAVPAQRAGAGGRRPAEAASASSSQSRPSLR